jgi:hypothetical protein
LLESQGANDLIYFIKKMNMVLSGQ